MYLINKDEAKVWLKWLAVACLFGALVLPAIVYAQDEPPVKDADDVSVGEVAPAATGGPDAFGYVYTDSDLLGGPTYGWVDITGTGTPIPVVDDSVHGPYAIGFTFNFYGNNYTQFYVDSNGYLSFSALPGPEPYNDCPLPDATTPDNLIAGIWDDIDPRQTGDGVYYQSFAAGTCPTGYGGACLVVLWDVNHYDYHYGDDVIFEIILFDGLNDFLIQIQDASSETGSSSTTGIENADGSIGLPYACNSSASIKDELAILFELALTAIVDPLMDYNYVDTYHTVYVDISVPVADVDVLLEVTGVNSASGSAPSNSAGVAEFTYFGANTGQDTIEACVDTNDNGRCDAREPTASATKYWIEPWEEPPVIVEEFVPEPGTVVLLGSGLMGLAGYATMRFRKKR